MSTRMNTACRKRTGEAWIEVKKVNASKVTRLEKKCMFTGGSKDSSTGSSMLCYMVVE